MGYPRSSFPWRILSKASSREEAALGSLFATNFAAAHALASPQWSGINARHPATAPVLVWAEPFGEIGGGYFVPPDSESSPLRRV